MLVLIPRLMWGSELPSDEYGRSQGVKEVGNRKREVYLPSQLGVWGISKQVGSGSSNAFGHILNATECL